MTLGFTGPSCSASSSEVRIQVGRRSKRTCRSHVGHFDIGLDAELLERLFGIHPQDQAGAEAHPADGEDLHDVFPVDWAAVPIRGG